MEEVVKSFIFPNISYLSLIKNFDTIALDVSENYQKKSFRNRYEIASANGRLSLSIPLVKGKANQTNIKDVRISYDTNWMKMHKETLRSAYGKSAYFEHYYPIVESVFDKQHKFLFDLNTESLKLILKALKLNIEIIESNAYLNNFMIPEVSKKYNQVFEYKYGFMPNLSSIDLLFNTGIEAIRYL